MDRLEKSLVAAGSTVLRSPRKAERRGGGKAERRPEGIAGTRPDPEPTRVRSVRGFVGDGRPERAPAGRAVSLV
jgi:hypothetical protein